MVIFVDPFCKPSVICFFITSINSISWIFSHHPEIRGTTFHLEVGDDFHSRLYETYGHLAMVVVENGDLLSDEQGNG